MNVFTVGFVAVQRPFVLVAMSISAVAFFGLGIWAIVEVVLFFARGELYLKPETTVFHVLAGIAVILGALVAPFVLCWVAAVFAKRAYAQIKKDGLIYKE